MKNIKIKKIILIIVLLAIIFYTALTCYKYFMLKEIKTKLMSYNESNNFKCEYGDNNFYYYKDGISKWVYQDSGSWLWTDGDVLYSPTENVQSPDNTTNSKLQFKMKDGVNLEDMNLIKIALNPFNTVKKANVNDIDCIEINYGNKEKIYFNATDKTPVKQMIYFEDDNSYFNTNYNFEKDIVTDEDIKLPEGKKYKFEKGNETPTEVES